MLFLLRQSVRATDISPSTSRPRSAFRTSRAWQKGIRKCMGSSEIYLRYFDICSEHINGIIYLSAMSEIAVKKLNLELSPNVLSLTSLLS